MVLNFSRHLRFLYLPNLFSLFLNLLDFSLPLNFRLFSLNRHLHRSRLLYNFLRTFIVNLLLDLLSLIWLTMLGVGLCLTVLMVILAVLKILLAGVFVYLRLLAFLLLAGIVDLPGSACREYALSFLLVAVGVFCLRVLLVVLVLVHANRLSIIVVES